MNAPAVVASHSSSSSSTSAHGKRLRPPTLTVSTTPPSNMRPPKTVIELETPAVEDPPPSLPLTMPTSASASSPAAGNTPYASALSALTPFREADVRRHGPQLSGDLSRDLAVLEQLRRSVQKNLMLRPLRASPTSSPSSQPPSRPLSISSTWSDYQTPTSPSSASSVYFTPITDRAPTAPSLSAHFLNTAAANAAAVAAGLPSASAVKPPPIALEPALIARRLSAPIRPLLIDTRPVGPYLTAHIKGSINMSIPSLILKRSRQPGKGFQSLDALRQYITTDEGREVWDALVQPASEWDGDVVVFDDDMDESDRDNPQVTAWALLPVIAPLLLHGSVDYLRGGMSAARAHRDIHPFLVEGDNHKTPLPSPPIPLAPGQRSAPQTATSPPLPPPQLSLPPKRRGATLPMLNTVDAAKQGKPLPEIERSAGPQSAISSASSIVPSHPWATLADATPSPPPSQSTFPRRKASQPTLAKLNTKSAERLTVSIPHHAPRSASSTSGRSSRSGSNASLLPPLALALPPHPPSPAPPGLKLVHSNHAPSAPGSSSPLSSREPSPLPTTPRTPLPPVPHTARQGMSAVSGVSVSGIDDPPPSTEEPYPTFVMSTILPRFLFLGPELTEEDHVRQLQDAGVKRILNLAIECDENDHGLRLAERFERYSKIPMRDTVEEENIVRGVREACDILDDASLHSAPTYVHCKAGKSRSVTAVMAYLIHANHWTLSRAYAFVLERRRGISPNIGFVSELMNFEEMELGGKSVGVVKEPQSADRDPSEGGAPGIGMGMGVGYASAAGARRPAHLRESLPPAFTLSADQVLMVGVGDVGQETEVRDASGRYRHARRAPVDENTLQPLRRVSKAGLESALHADFL